MILFISREFLAVLMLISCALTGTPCYEGDGATYRGFVAKSISGHVCQKWSSQSPNQHSRTSEKYPSSGLQENYCRNPDGEPAPWCYTVDGPRWELCDVCDRGFWIKNLGKYLSGYSAGTAKYDSLLTAQSECLKRSDCGGITYETVSKMFTLRRGFELTDSPSDEISWIAIPITWSKHLGKYLSGYSAGTAKYDSLLTAESECLERSDCGGITYETVSKMFTLRRGVNLADSPSDEISWIAIPRFWIKNRGKYLSGYSAGTAKYDSLLTAESECLKRSDCGGITYETISEMFTLRRGINLIDSPSDEISWIVDPRFWIKNRGKYLSGYSAGTAKYDSLLTAVSECLKRSDCGGITYETISKMFTLRRGINLIDSPSDEISWIAIPSF